MESSEQLDKTPELPQRSSFSTLPNGSSRRSSSRQSSRDAILLKRQGSIHGGGGGGGSSSGSIPLNDSLQRQQLSFLMQERCRSGNLQQSMRKNCARSGSGRTAANRGESSLVLSRQRQGYRINEEHQPDEELDAQRKRVTQLQFRLRFLYRLIIATYRLCHKHYLTCHRLGSAFRAQSDVITEWKGVDGGSRIMLFNKSDFKANKPMRLSTEARRILAKSPEDRSEAEINYAVLALRGIQQLADYPVRMQRNLARLGVLESYCAGRVIVRQNHPAQAFYIITYGVVLVCVVDQSADVAHTVVELSRGDSFGELAIVIRGKRQSTVIGKTDCDLLVLDIPTYESIFLQGGQKVITDPDHNDFIKSLGFLQGWPIHHLQQQSDKFVFCYFKRSAVIVKNSRMSRWIYIVKSGSAQVLLALKKTSPQVASRWGELLPAKSTAENAPVNLTATDSSHLPAMWQFYDSVGLYRPLQCRSAPQAAERMRLPAGCGVGFPLRRPLTVAPAGGGKRAESAASRNLRPLSVETRSEALANFLSKVSDSKEPDPASVKSGGGANGGIRMGRKTFYDFLDDGQVEKPSNPEFVRLSTLTRGGVFGLQDLVTRSDDPPQPSLCVLSNGAECLLLEKNFFLEQAPRRLLDRLRNQVALYPSRDELQLQLQSRMDWEAYKRMLVESLAGKQQ